MCGKNVQYSLFVHLLQLMRDWHNIISQWVIGCCIFCALITCVGDELLQLVSCRYNSKGQYIDMFLITDLI